MMLSRPVMMPKSAERQSNCVQLQLSKVEQSVNLLIKNGSNANRVLLFVKFCN
jgi:hypothetical protein